MTVEEKIKSVDWVSEVGRKNSVFRSRGYRELNAPQVFRAIFPSGSLEKGREDRSGKGCAYLMRLHEPDAPESENLIRLYDDMAGIELVNGRPFPVISPVSYFGKWNSGRNAHALFAITIDIDFVTSFCVENLLDGISDGRFLPPSVVVNSGNGLHLYYLLAEPIRITHYKKPELDGLKRHMTALLWTRGVSVADEPEYKDLSNGILQGFRFTGGLTKSGARVRAWRVTGARYSVDELSRFYDYKPPMRQNEYAMIRAKLDFPKWYEKRIVNKEPKIENWLCNRGFFDKFKEQIKKHTPAGHRYYAIRGLCSAAIKCGVSEYEARAAAMELLPILDAKTIDEKNHFTKQDIADAIKSIYGDAGKREKAMHFTAAYIYGGAKVPLERQRRNHREQNEHLRLARERRDKLQAAKGTRWTDNAGRKSRFDEVELLRALFPNVTQKECAIALKMDIKTVKKHWEKASERPFYEVREDYFQFFGEYVTVEGWSGYTDGRIISVGGYLEEIVKSGVVEHFFDLPEFIYCIVRAKREREHKNK